VKNTRNDVSIGGDPSPITQNQRTVPPLKILISGGQTGADRAGLDVAIRHGFPHGGWCPKGRKAEDGPIGGQYNLSETPTGNYLIRTEWNVRDSDGTVVLTLGRETTGGSLRTINFARKHKKPCLHLSSHGSGYANPALPLIQFVGEHGIQRLNIAGTRESKEPGIHAWTYQVIEDAFFWNEAHTSSLGGPGEG